MMGINSPNIWFFKSLISVKIPIGYFLIYSQLLFEGYLPRLPLFFPLGCINARFSLPLPCGRPYRTGRD